METAASHRDQAPAAKSFLSKDREVALPDSKRELWRLD